MIVIIEVSNFISSSQSKDMPSYSFLLRVSHANKRFSQYFVSCASLSAICNLFTKSASEAAYCDSAIFAPILVPLRNNCSKIGRSSLSFKCRYSLTILIEKSNYLFCIAFSFSFILSIFCAFGCFYLLCNTFYPTFNAMCIEVFG